MSDTLEQRARELAEEINSRQERRDDFIDTGGLKRLILSALQRVQDDRDAQWRICLNVESGTPQQAALAVEKRVQDETVEKAAKAVCIHAGRTDHVHACALCRAEVPCPAIRIRRAFSAPEGAGCDCGATRWNSVPALEEGQPIPHALNCAARAPEGMPTEDQR